MTEHPTPASLGYRLPAEWEPHAATWLAWPHNRDTWPDALNEVAEVYARLVRVLTDGERVHVLGGTPAAAAQARELIGDVAGVTVHDIPTDDAWLRDYGPIFLAGPAGAAPALVDWEYNAWGDKYPPYDHDNAVPRIIAERFGRRRFAPGIVLEGGSIDANGRGSLLVTDTCLLNENRNPSLTRDQIERFLRDYLAVDTVIWLSGEIAGDDTDGHVDQIARFADEQTIVAAVPGDDRDQEHAPLWENVRRLESMRDGDGRELRVVTLPLPGACFHGQDRIPASYCNFYIANKVVIVPQFGDAADERAVQTLAPLFPSRTVVGLPSTTLARGLGSFHCITRQQPEK